MITASEARRLSKPPEPIISYEDLDSVFTEIEKRAKAGHKGVLLKLEISQCNKLLKLGFDVFYYQKGAFGVSWDDVNRRQSIFSVI